MFYARCATLLQNAENNLKKTPHLHQNFMRCGLSPSCRVNLLERYALYSSLSTVSSAASTSLLASIHSLGSALGSS